RLERKLYAAIAASVTVHRRERIQVLPASRRRRLFLGHLCNPDADPLDLLGICTGRIFADDRCRRAAEQATLHLMSQLGDSTVRELDLHLDAIAAKRIVDEHPAVRRSKRAMADG